MRGLKTHGRHGVMAIAAWHGESGRGIHACMHAHGMQQGSGEGVLLLAAAVGAVPCKGSCRRHQHGLQALRCTYK